MPPTPHRSDWMVISISLLAVGGLLGFHVHRLEAQQASLEVESGRHGLRAAPHEAERSGLTGAASAGGALSREAPALKALLTR